MLKDYKTANGLSIKELAARLNLSVPTVYRILNNVSIGNKSIKAIARLLKKDEIEVYEYYKRK